MEIDLTNMTPEMTRELNRIAEQYRKPYTEFIDGLSEQFADAKFWWDTPLASRNTFICRNFLDICILRLAINLARQGRGIKWIVRERRIRQALRDNLGVRSISSTSSVKSGFKAKLKEKIFSYSWASSECAFYTFQRRIRKMQKWHSKGSLETFRGRGLTLVSTYRVPAEARAGVLQDRYFPGLKENSDEDIVFLAFSVFDSEAEGKLLSDVLHASEDHICIEDWIEPDDFREVREYIRWCRKVSAPQCTFDGMDVTALVKEALRTGASNDNAMWGIVKGRALCRLVEQYGLKIKYLIDWHEGQPSSNAMIRRFRAKYSAVPTVACSPFPYEENLLSLHPSERQVTSSIVPEYFTVMGRAWKNQVCQFSKDAKCIVGPSFRHDGLWADTDKISSEGRGILLILPIFEDCSAQLLTAFGKAIWGKGENIGPIYIKNHPVNQGYVLSDYGVAETLFRGKDVVYLTDDLSESLQGKAIVILSKTTSTLEVMLRGIYTIVFVPAGELSAVCVPEEMRPKVTVAYTVEDLRDCLQSQKAGLSDMEIEQIREASFTRVNRETVAEFLEPRTI